MIRNGESSANTSTRRPPPAASFPRMTGRSSMSATLAPRGSEKCPIPSTKTSSVLSSVTLAKSRAWTSDPRVLWQMALPAPASPSWSSSDPTRLMQRCENL